MNALSGAIGLAELSALARSDAAFSALSNPPWVLLQLDSAAADPSAAQAPMIASWLRRQPCPVIGVGADAHALVQQACDVVVADAVEAAPVLANVGESPRAAAVLVQVLRVTESLPIEAALVVESLAYSTLQGGPEFARWLAARQRSSRARDAGPPVLLERVGATVEIRLNRPARRNALSVEMRDALCEALEFVAADPSIELARLSGMGPCFCSGGDLDEFGTAPDPATAHVVRSLRLPASALLRCAGRVEFRLHGGCVGAGAELPAFAPRVRATSDAWFQLPEVPLGLIPGAGGCVSIPRRIGRQRTAYMALSAARIDAPTALAWGLIDAIVD